MVDEIRDRAGHHAGVRRGEHDELVRMKARADAVFAAEGAAGSERGLDLRTGGKFFDGIADLRMGFQRQDLTVDPEGADAVMAAECQRFHEGAGIAQADLIQIMQLLRPGLLFKKRRRGAPELDRFPSKNAAQSEPYRHHDIRKFAKRGNWVIRTPAAAENRRLFHPPSVRRDF